MIYICSADRQQVSKRRSSSGGLKQSFCLSPLSPVEKWLGRAPLTQGDAGEMAREKICSLPFPRTELLPTMPFVSVSKWIKRRKSEKGLPSCPRASKAPKVTRQCKWEPLKNSNRASGAGGREVVHAVKAINASLSLKKGNCAANADRFDRKCLHWEIAFWSSSRSFRNKWTKAPGLALTGSGDSGLQIQTLWKTSNICKQ